MTRQTIPRGRLDFERVLQEHARDKALEALESFYIDYPVDISEPLAEMWYEGLELANRLFVERLPMLQEAWGAASLDGDDPWQNVLNAAGMEGVFSKAEQEEYLKLYFDTFNTTVRASLMNTIKEMIGVERENDNGNA